MNQRPLATPESYNAAQLAQDRRSLARMRRHDARVRSLRLLGVEILVKAVAPSVMFALIVVTTGIR